MATLPDRPVYGQAYRLDPDNGTKLEFRPDDDEDEQPWDVEWSDGTADWCTDAEVEALPGGALVPVPTADTAP